jgi:hypothetical protein
MVGNPALYLWEATEGIGGILAAILIIDGRVSDRHMDPDQSLKARCHKCGADMIYVTSLPHPSAPGTMMRTTFVCRACNQTRNYSLSIEMAEAYATACAQAAEPLN